MFKVLVAPGLWFVWSVLSLASMGCLAAHSRSSALTPTGEDQSAVEVVSVAAAPLALQQIWKLRDERSGLATLSELSRHPEPQVRAESLRALALVGDPAGVDVIKAGLDDASAEVRGMAAFALSQHHFWPLSALAARTTAAELEQELLDAIDRELEDVGLSSAALPALVRALAEFGGPDPAVEERLWELLSVMELPPGTKGQALISLALLARAQRAEPLTVDQLETLQLLYGQHSELGWQLAYLLAHSTLAVSDDTHVDPQAATVESGGQPFELVTSLLDGEISAQQRCWALRAVGLLAPLNGAGLLRPVLTTSSSAPRQRICALRGLASWKLGSIELLQEALSDPLPTVRSEAARVLVSLGSPGLEVLLSRLKNPTDQGPVWLVDLLDVLAEGVRALAGENLSGSDRVVLERRMQQAVSAEEPQLRASAYGLAAALGGDSAMEELLAAVESEHDPGALIALAVAIGSWPEVRFEGVLLGWLQGADPTLAAIAAEALAERPGAHLKGPLLETYRRFSGEPDNERRRAVVLALQARGELDQQLRAEVLEDPVARVRMAAYVGHSGDDDPAPPLGRGPTRWLGDWSPGVQIAKVETNRGVLSFALLSKQAPVAVASFTRLAREGYFDGLLVHRVVADFVIQSGDPSGSGWGGPGYTLADEFGPLPFSPGSLGMARVEKDSAGSQWFVTHSAQPHLDGRYTLFGQLFDGFDVLAQIRRGDRVKSVRILP